MLFSFFPFLPPGSTEKRQLALSYLQLIKAPAQNFIARTLSDRGRFDDLDVDDEDDGEAGEEEEDNGWEEPTLSPLDRKIGGQPM